MIKFIKYLLFILCFSLSLNPVLGKEAIIQKYMQELDELNDSQKEIMYRAYLAGEPYDLGYSMVVIAWKESRFGKYMLNLSDGKHGSYGVYHILLDYSMVRNKINSNWSKSRLAERLLNDFDFSSNEALTILRYWRDRYNRTDISKYYYMFSSYNGGGKALANSQARSYGEDSMLRLTAVIRYFNKNRILAELKNRSITIATSE